MKKIQIEISDDEYKALAKRVKEKKEFDKVEDYVKDIVSQVVERLKEESADEESFSKEDEEKVKDRLRSLGYLD